jgi:hypothetical protein
MIIYVIVDDFVCYVTTRRAKKSSSPKMAAPIFLANFWKLLLNLPGTSAFGNLDEFTYRDMRRNLHKYVNMVGRQNSIYNLYTKLVSCLCDYFANAHTQVSLKYFIAVLGYPDDMIAMVKNSMAGLVIIGHAQVSGASKRACMLRIPEHDSYENIGLKSFSPKGEGFNQEKRL